MTSIFPIIPALFLVLLASQNCAGILASPLIASWLMVSKFLCTTVGKYYKLPLGMQRPTVNNELRIRKGRCGTCKGRMFVML